jgi:hypothetical protein
MPSCAASRCNAALTMGLTQRTRCTVFRLVLPCFFVRVVLLLSGCDRAGVPCGSGWTTFDVPRVSAVLSCSPKRLPASPAAPFDCSGKTNLSNCGFLLLDRVLLHYDRPTPAISVREITKTVQPFRETIGVFATINPSPHKRRSSLVSMLPRFPSLSSRTSFRFENF